MFARDEQIKRLETIDRSRGARDGALAVGVPAFLLGVGLTALLFHSSENNAQTGGSPNGQTGDSLSTPAVTGAALAVGAVLLAVGVAVGTLYGAVAGHRDVYIVEP